MIQKLQTRRGGFTLVEIMIVVAIIALLAAIAVPNFLRARKRSEATRILEDLRMLDSATDQYAIENNKTTGTNPTFSRPEELHQDRHRALQHRSGPLRRQLRTRLHRGHAARSIPANAWLTLSDVAPYTFWSPYHN